MCVGVPAKVLERDEYTAVVDVLGSKVTVGVIMVSDVKVNDYVLVHAGQALAIVDEEFALVSMEEWRKLADARDS